MDKENADRLHAWALRVLKKCAENHELEFMKYIHGSWVLCTPSTPYRILHIFFTPDDLVKEARRIYRTLDNDHQA